VFLTDVSLTTSWLENEEWHADSKKSEDSIQDKKNT